MMWKNLLLVALGSGTGGVLRYLTSLLFQSDSPAKFPWSTLTINLIGSFCIGVIIALSQRLHPISEQTRLLLSVGFCGGFTTFSAFALENIHLIRSGNTAYAMMYIVASVVLSILLTALGMALFK
ncbi:MAG: fluoride efflux transporter CrcB [Bacteroidota bacterium]